MLDSAPFDWLERDVSVTRTGLYTAEELYRLLPAVYRVRDAEQGGVLRELVDVSPTRSTCSPRASSRSTTTSSSRRARRGWRRTSATSSATARCTASCRRSPRRARRSRTRSATAGARAPSRCSSSSPRDVTGWPARAVEFFELLATTQYMNHVRPHAAATADLRDEARLELAGSVPGGRVRRLRAHGRDAAIASRLGPLQHPERRHLPLARAGAAARALAARRRRRLGPALPLRPARDGQAALRAAAHRAGDHAPRRAARRAAAAAAPLREARTSPSSTAPGRSLLLETETAARRRPVLAADVRICDLSDDPAVPGRVGARAAAGRHARRGRSGARPRRVPGRAGGRRDAARDLPLRLGARGRRRRLRPREVARAS